MSKYGDDALLALLAKIAGAQEDNNLVLKRIQQTLDSLTQTVEAIRNIARWK